MLVHDALDICLARHLDEVTCLNNIKAIEHVDHPHPFKWKCESVINEIKEYISNPLGGNGNLKVVHLTFEDNAFAVNKAGVQARFICSWGELEGAKDGISVFFP